MSNSITAFFKGRAGVAESVYQYDYGKVLIIDGLNLPATFEVHFTTVSEDDAITVIGQNNRVAIPNSCISIPGTVTAYIYLHTGDNDGETEYVIKFAVIRRARPDYDEDDKSDWESAASQALAMLQNSKKVNTPLDEYNQVDNGTAGQLLRTKGNGATEWVDEGLPTDAQTNAAVSAWLDEHPEATTTVDFAVVTKVFPTVTQMTEDLTLESGDTVRTMGYYANNDKGGGLFKVSDVADSGSTQSILLSNGLYAVRIKDVCVTPQMFGAKGNWESNPASNSYSSMEDLLKDYPLAQSLSDEMDLLAVESAIAKNNRILYIPIGGYYFNRTITLPVGQVIFGDGTANTQITYNGTDANMLVVNSNVILKDLKLSHQVTPNVVGTESTVTAIKAFSTNRSRYEGIQINGFNYGINFNVDSWCNYVINCSINYCNYGISGQNEFNAVVISQCALSYNNYGIRVGSGRTIVIEKCTLERNNYGITKFDHGDIIVKGCYFELHNNRSIYVIYSSYPVELITIQNCSFYTNTDDEVFIGLAGNAKTLANIIHNIFECNANSLDENETIKCIQSSSNAIIFNIANNFLFTGCEIGVESKYIKGYTDNGKHIVYTSSSNLASAFANGVKSVRFEFSTNGTVTLPDLSNVADGEEVRKFVGLWTGSSDYTDASIMNIDTTGKTIYGEKIVRPNVIYSIYYQKSNDIYFVFR